MLQDKSFHTYRVTRVTKTTGSILIHKTIRHCQHFRKYVSRQGINHELNLLSLPKDGIEPALADRSINPQPNDVSCLSYKWGMKMFTRSEAEVKKYNSGKAYIQRCAKGSQTVSSQLYFYPTHSFNAPYLHFCPSSDFKTAPMSTFGLNKQSRDF